MDEARRPATTDPGGSVPVVGHGSQTEVGICGKSRRAVTETSVDGSTTVTVNSAEC